MASLGCCSSSWGWFATAATTTYGHCLELEVTKTSPTTTNTHNSLSISSCSLVSNSDGGAEASDFTWQRRPITKARTKCNIRLAAASRSGHSALDDASPLVLDKDNNYPLDAALTSTNTNTNTNPKLSSSDATLAVHAGQSLGRGIVTDAITTPIVNTSAYSFKNTAELIAFKEGRHESYEYGGYGNATTKVAEEKISALEGAEETLLLASGMTASVVMMMALAPKGGGHIVTTTDCYRKTRIFIETILPNYGVTATIIDPTDMDALKSPLYQHSVFLFFSEAPTNPYLRCIDIELVSKLCHTRGALVCIDSTFASPVNQKALALGANLVLNSATKYIAGHNDVIGGCISGSGKYISKVRLLHHILGGVLNPNAAYLILRGMKTMHLRLQHQNSVALRMAKISEEHPKVIRVHYPGLPSHPEHHVAKRQMSGFGGVVSFEVAGDFMATRRFVDALKIPYIAPSFGGCESFVDPPAIMSYWDLSPDDRAKFGIKDNLIWFSFGLEDFDDLRFDILQALEAI